MNRDELIAIRLELIKRKFTELNREDANLVVVSKYYPVEDIIFAYDAGQRDFGENRVDDLIEKAASLEHKEDINWHFIGHLQSNKINRLLKVKGLKYIHSVDSVKLMESLFKREENFPGNELHFFLQVNTSGEKEKGGLENYQELASAINLIEKYPDSKFKLTGLMTMGKIRTDDQKGEAVKCFRQLVSMRCNLENDFGVTGLQLSMGMTDDYEIALKEGADFVRIGSAIFSKEN